MKEKIKQFLVKYRKLTGVEICIHEEAVHYHLITIQLKGNSLDIINKKHAIPSEEQLFALLPKDIPLALTVSGKGIIHKQLVEQSADWQALLQQSLPNVDSNDFTGQSMSTSEGQLISIIRKTTLDKLLESFDAYPVVSLATGLPALEACLPLIGNGKYTTSTYSIEISQNVITSYEALQNHAVTQTIDLGGELLNSLLLPAFGTALTTILNPEKQLFSYETIEKKRSGYQHAKLATKIGWTGLGLLLITLLINFMIFAQLNSKNNQLSNEMAYNQLQATEIQQLQKQLDTKTATLSNNQLLAPSKIAYYADEIAQLIPTGILLDQLKIFPPAETSNRQASTSFSSSSVYIKGSCKNSALLNLWIRQLEGLDWVESLKVLPYRETDKGVGIFELELSLFQQ